VEDNVVPVRVSLFTVSATTAPSMYRVTPAMVPVPEWVTTTWCQLRH